MWWKNGYFLGGFNYQYNLYIYSSEQPDRYPMCRLSDMFTNLEGTYMYIGLGIYTLLKKGGVVPFGMIAFLKL